MVNQPDRPLALSPAAALRYHGAMAIEIREASADEYVEAGRVTAAAYREFVAPGETAWESYLGEIADVAARAPRTHIVITVEDGRIVGSATLELEGRVDEGTDRALEAHEAHIRMLGVHPDARGHGVATRLMDACETSARDGGKTLMTLHTTSRMRGAQAMYESRGYERMPDRVFPDGFVLMSYRKAL
jgi:ribosomal protein S18 acetylase RimI-like enzyme